MYNGITPFHFSMFTLDAGTLLRVNADDGVFPFKGLLPI